MLIHHFETARLMVSDWTDSLQNPRRRPSIEKALSGMLTEPVLRNLPPTLHLGDCSISNWMSERAAESDVYLVCRTGQDTPIGLLLLAVLDEANDRRTAHIGYLFAQDQWGRGYATELIKGLVAAAQSHIPITLRAGVDISNPSSASVLRKAGFSTDSSQPDPQMEKFRLDLI